MSRARNLLSRADSSVSPRFLFNIPIRSSFWLGFLSPVIAHVFAAELLDLASMAFTYSRSKINLN